MICAFCGYANRPGQQVCANCGKPLQTASAGEGERKLVTMLFADIVGSTAAAERLDPEDWREIVSGVHNGVIQAIERYGGTVVQILGDGLLAFFGAPLAHEDDAERRPCARRWISRLSCKCTGSTCPGWMSPCKCGLGCIPAWL